MKRAADNQGAPVARAPPAPPAPPAQPAPAVCVAGRASVHYMPPPEVCEELLKLSLRQNCKAIETAFWAESLRPNHELRIVAVTGGAPDIAGSAGPYYVLMKGNSEWTSKLASFSEHAYTVTDPSTGRAIPAKALIACTQNSVYFVRMPIGRGQMTAEMFGKLNDSVDAGYDDDA